MKKGEFKYRVGDKIGGSTIKALCEKHIVITCSCGADKNMGRKNMYKFNGDCNCPKHLGVKPGSVWGRLTVIKATKFSKSKSLFECKCECGAIREVRSNSLITGKTTSCGCTRRSIQKDREDPIINDYASGIKIDDLCIKYDVGPIQIREMMDRRGKKRRSPAETVIRHPMDETVFESLTRDSMYWLGMLGADGNVFENRVTLGLKSSDIDHLRKFKDFCKSEHPVKLAKKGAFSVFKFTSVRVAKSLAKFGITPKKSLTFDPYWYCKNNADFWRGMIDGDGGIYVKKGVFSIMLCGSKETVHGFAEWTRPICGTTAKPRKVLNIYHFSLSANMAKKVCAVLYANDPKYYLERKAKTMQSVLNIKLPAYAL